MLPLRTPAGFAAFTDALKTVLQRWDVLRTAVVEQWGGVRSGDKFSRVLDDLLANLDEQWREGNDVHEDTLDVYFIECLEESFNVEFDEDSDDGWVTEVSLVCLLYTSPSPRDRTRSRMPSSA